MISSRRSRATSAAAVTACARRSAKIALTNTSAQTIDFGDVGLPLPFNEYGSGGDIIYETRTVYHSFTWTTGFAWRRRGASRARRAGARTRSSTRAVREDSR